jgi:hypothetical protein
MKIKLFFTAFLCLLITVLLSCTSGNLIILEGQMKDMGNSAWHIRYKAIVTTGGEEYVIQPEELAETMKEGMGIWNYVMRFTVLPREEKYFIGVRHTNNIVTPIYLETVTPVSWEIINTTTGKVIKKHPKRKSRWQSIESWSKSQEQNSLPRLHSVQPEGSSQGNSPAACCACGYFCIFIQKYPDLRAAYTV